MQEYRSIAVQYLLRQVQTTVDQQNDVKCGDTVVKTFGSLHNCVGIVSAVTVQ